MYSVIKSRLCYDGRPVGMNEKMPGFEHYLFKGEIGRTKGGTVYEVRHRILQIPLMIRIAIENPDDPDYDEFLNGAAESAAAKTDAIFAPVFDAGIYDYPVKTAYSVMRIMEGSGICTFRTFHDVRRSLFPCIERLFNRKDAACMYSLKISMNLAAGLLKTVMALYGKNMVHGDLDPGNVIWVLDEQDAVEQIRKISSTLSQADLLTPYPIRMIDAGKDSGDAKKKAMARDSWNVYAETKELLRPLFTKKRYSFREWMNFNVDETNEGSLRDLSNATLKPAELAGDLFRMICVLTLITKFVNENRTPEAMDFRDLNLLMSADASFMEIESFSDEVNGMLRQLSASGSTGRLIMWKKVLENNPLMSITLHSEED
ncbi:MAG: hypothetical protein IKG55_06505 [Solobacterium sp.]|nr:hypothetical protein [Solobacterium sp.]